ncbi:MAG: DM13 domain-containing protein [Pseudomonadota bacterium]
MQRFWRKFVFGLASHAIVLCVGFGLGVYFLPILTAERSPDSAVLAETAEAAAFSAALTRELRGSDLLHWGEGVISVSPTQIIHQGTLSPGPDYKVYLVPEFAEDEDEFNALKDRSVQIGDVKAFDGFILDIPATVDITAYNTVLVWCEAFGEFITAAQYR